MAPAPGENGTHYRTCPLCEATCGLAIEVEDGRNLTRHPIRLLSGRRRGVSR